jgi:hypothetical protein
MYMYMSGNPLFHRAKQRETPHNLIKVRGGDEISDWKGGGFTIPSCPDPSYV